MLLLSSTFLVVFTTGMLRFPATEVAAARGTVVAVTTSVGRSTSFVKTDSTQKT